MNKIKSFYTLAAFILFIACKGKTEDGTIKSGPYQRIDLFKEHQTQINEPRGPISVDSAFRYCELVVNAGSVMLADSSRARSDRDDFYLYTATIDTVLKGTELKKNSKIIFTSYAKLPGLPSGTYTLYLLPLAEHRMIKKGLHVQWQWLAGAPFLEIASAGIR